MEVRIQAQVVADGDIELCVAVALTTIDHFGGRSISRYTIDNLNGLTLYAFGDRPVFSCGVLVCGSGALPVTRAAVRVLRHAQFNVVQKQIASELSLDVRKI